MMTNQQIEGKIKEILAKKLGIGEETIASDSRLAEDLGVDSFGAIELMFEIEEAFGLKIPDSDIEHVRRVNDITAYVATWLAKQPKS